MGIDLDRYTVCLGLDMPTIYVDLNSPTIYIGLWPTSVAQLNVRLAGDQEVAGSIPARSSNIL